MRRFCAWVLGSLFDDIPHPPWYRSSGGYDFSRAVTVAQTFLSVLLGFLFCKALP
jgi:hypothetical protein